jgi:type IV secretory pathway TrbL component
VLTLAFAAGGLLLAAGVAQAATGGAHLVTAHKTSHHSHSGSDSDSGSGSDVQGSGGPEAAASDVRPAGVPVVGTAKAVTAATSVVPDPGTSGSGD